MLPLVAVLRVVNVLPQVQVTWVSVYSGWMSFFMVFLSRGSVAGSSEGAPSGGNRNQPSSVPKINTPVLIRSDLTHPSQPLGGRKCSVSSERQHHPGGGPLAQDRLHLK